MSCDPEKHHRHSIRLKGHDYAGGGLYFVTICAHREMVAAMEGKPFGGLHEMATSVSPLLPMRRIIEAEWRRSGEIRNDVKKVSYACRLRVSESRKRGRTGFRASEGVSRA